MFPIIESPAFQQNGYMGYNMQSRFNTSSTKHKVKGAFTILKNIENPLTSEQDANIVKP